jgi:hypothetical protein
MWRKTLRFILSKIVINPFPAIGKKLPSTFFYFLITRTSGGGRGGWAPARKCPSLVNIYNFNKNN